MDSMALRGTPIPAALVVAAVRLARVSGIRAAARRLGIDRNTVRRYVRGLDGRPPAGAADTATGGSLWQPEVRS
jgi:hypothetical protein